MQGFILILEKNLICLIQQPLFYQMDPGYSGKVGSSAFYANRIRKVNNNIPNKPIKTNAAIAGEDFVPDLSFKRDRFISDMMLKIIANNPAIIPTKNSASNASASVTKRMNNDKTATTAKNNAVKPNELTELVPFCFLFSFLLSHF